MANAKLIINPARLNARIVFANNGTSILFETQKQLSSALPDLVSMKKITQLEAVEIFKTAIYSKDFPVDIEGEDEHTNVSEGFLDNMDEMLMSALFQKIFGNMKLDASSEPLFKACGCGKHGMIMFGVDEKGEAMLSGNITSKHHGLMFVTLHEEKFGLHSKYVEKLRREILSSTLPEKI